MNTRIKNKHKKAKEREINALKKEGYIVNENEFFKCHLSLGMGILKYITFNGETHLGRYGFDNNRNLGFNDEFTHEFTEISNVRGFKKSQIPFKEPIHVSPIDFNVIDSVISVENVEENENYEFCEVSDDNYLIFGFKKEGVDQRFLSPNYFEVDSTYKDDVEKYLNQYKKENELYYNKIISMMEKYNISLDNFAETKYGNFKR